MKRVGVIGLVLASIIVVVTLFLVINGKFTSTGFATAPLTYSCSSDQIILSLFSTSNSHGETWNGGGSYSKEICYNELFGKTYAGANPHACTGSNAVLNLSSLTNAHAEITSAGYYPNSVCYGDLVCTVVNGVCPAGKVSVVTLSSNTNAHLAADGSYVANGVNICCSSPSAPPIPCNHDNKVDAGEQCDGNNVSGKTCTDLGFTGGSLGCTSSCTLDTTSCSSATHADCNPNTLMCESMAGPGPAINPCSIGSSCAISNHGECNLSTNTCDLVAGPGPAINPCFNQGGACTISPVTFNVLISPTNAVINVGNSTSFKVYLNYSNGTVTDVTSQPMTTCISMDSTIANNPAVDCKFTGMKPGNVTIKGIYSGQFATANLTVIPKTEAACNPGNRAPNVVINTPYQGIYFVNAAVPFSATAIDPDGDSVILKWNIDDTLDNTTAAQTSFSHGYTTNGVKQIIITATDVHSGVCPSASSVNETSILVAKPGVNVYPIIDQPIYASQSSNFNTAFNGTSSFVINVTNTSISAYNVSCLGGACPTSTIGCPVGVLCPSGLMINNSANLNDYSKMYFNWTFGGINGSQEANAKTTGSQTYSYVGQNNITLSLSAYNKSDGITNIFFITGTPMCSVDKSQYFSGVQWFPTVGPNAAGCFGLGNDGSDCCPTTGFICINTTHSSFGSYCFAGGCNTTTSYPDITNGTHSIFNCNDYNYVAGNQQAQCNQDCAGAGSRTDSNDPASDYWRALQANPGRAIINYSCKWITNSTGAGSCGFIYNVTGGTGPPGNPSDCKYLLNTTDSGCVDGQRTIGGNQMPVKKIPGGYQLISPSGTCPLIKIDPQTFSCVDNSLQLPFFGWIEGLISISLIAAIYLIYNYKKRK